MCKIIMIIKIIINNLFVYIYDFQNVNTCPIDRREFNVISVRPYIGADIHKRVNNFVELTREIFFDFLQR